MDDRTVVGTNTVSDEAARQGAAQRGAARHQGNGVSACGEASGQGGAIAGANAYHCANGLFHCDDLSFGSVR